MSSAIDRLEELVWYRCVTQIAPKDETTLNRWRNNEYEHSRESLQVSPLPLDLISLVEEAIKEWDVIEGKALEKIIAMNDEDFDVPRISDFIDCPDTAILFGEDKEKPLSKKDYHITDRDSFLRKFKEIRESFLRGDDLSNTECVSIGIKVNGAVKNINWVSLFSIYLPQADVENVESRKKTGQMVVAFYYFETLFKHVLCEDEYSVPSFPDMISKLEGRWKFVE